MSADDSRPTIEETPKDRALELSRRAAGIAPGIGSILGRGGSKRRLSADGKGWETTTTLLSSIDGLEEAASVSPGIYQAYEEKAYEVRLVVMGCTYFAVKIDSQSDESSRLDWRNRPEYTAGIVECMEIPEEVRLAVFKFLDTLSIVFGSFDFIVSPSNEWIFLELNTGAFSPDCYSKRDGDRAAMNWQNALSNGRSGKSFSSHKNCPSEKDGKKTDHQMISSSPTSYH